MAKAKSGAKSKGGSGAKAGSRSPAGSKRSAAARSAAAPPVPLEELRQIPAFVALSDDDARCLLSIATVRDLARGDIVFSQGQVGDGLYAILSGSVHVVKTSEKGVERVVATLERHEVFGEMDLIGDRPHTAGIRGAEATRLLFLPKGAFQAMLRAGNPGATAMVCYFAVMLAGRLDANNRRMIEVLDQETPERRTGEFAEFKRRLLQEWSF